MAAKPIDMAKFGDHLKEVGKAIEGEEMASVMAESYDAIVQNVRDNFTSSVTPGGDPWPERKKIGDGHPLLIESGDLLQASTGGGSGHIKVIEPRAVEMGVSADSIRHAATHNFGDPSRNIPSREYLGASEDTLEQIGEEIAKDGERFFVQ